MGHQMNALSQKKLLPRGGKWKCRNPASYNRLSVVFDISFRSNLSFDLCVWMMFKIKGCACTQSRYNIIHVCPYIPDVRHALLGVGMISWEEGYGMPCLEKDYNNISKFLNRILGVPILLQNALFKYFQDTLKAVILQAKRNGRWDLGILGKF